jgi:predicted phosphoribosyltransferase
MKIIELPEKRNRMDVYRDRSDAGKILAGMMENYRSTKSLVMAIPAGGVEVGAVLAESLHLLLDVAVVSKITPPWSSEVGYGAVAFDESVLLNKSFLERWHLSDQEVQDGIARAKVKVGRRLDLWRSGRPFPVLTGKTIIVVDDGLATGYTMQAAIGALRRSGAWEIIVAVPTAHVQSVEGLRGMADILVCGNIREEEDFAVANAYRHWRDIDELEVEGILRQFRERHPRESPRP